MSFKQFLRRIFRRDDYSSEVTQFIDKLKADQPDLEARQRAGRSIWWDKSVDRAAQAEWKEARVPQKPYVYSNGD
jgi:hypothetical protein